MSVLKTLVVGKSEQLVPGMGSAPVVQAAVVPQESWAAPFNVSQSCLYDNTPWVGASPLGWQFTQRGLCKTARTVSKAASAFVRSAAGAVAGAGGGACEQEHAATVASCEPAARTRILNA